MAKLRVGALICVSLVAAASLEAGSLEWRPSIGGGYSRVVESHASLGVALRLQLAGYLFVQPEYLTMLAEGHTDHGPTLLVGLSGKSRTSLRPFAGLGGGPLDGYQGDDGILFFAVGASHPVGQSGVFVQGEFRYGLLGESAYSQFGVSVGLSR